MVDASASRSSTRDRILSASARLLAEGGRSAVTTRGVAELAGAQAPTIYRLFGDKDGLLDAVAEHVMTEFAVAKASADADADPVTALRDGWDLTIDFGLTNADLFVLMSDPSRALRSPAAQAGIRLLADRVHRLALSGRLRLSEDQAVEFIHAAGTGAILATLARPAAQRDHRLSDIMLESVLDQILTPADPTPMAEANDITASAISLRARTADLTALTANERTLLVEWLNRVIDEA